MNAIIPYEEQPMRAYRTKPLYVQLLQSEFIKDHFDRYITEIENLSDTTKNQRLFFRELLELPGVIRITIFIGQVVIWRWPGYRWEDIEPEIIRKIESCPISQEDLDEQLDMILKKWK